MSNLTLNSGATPTTPASGKITLFASSSDDDMLSVVNDTGAEFSLTPQPYNYIRNSGFWFAQRQDPIALTTYSTTTGRAVTADGFGITNENASTQYIRTDTSTATETGLTARFYGSFTKITSNGKLVISQVVETNDIANLRGKMVRVQILAKSIVAASATWRLALVQLTNAGNANAVAPKGGGSFITAFGVASTDPTLGTNLNYIPPEATVTPDNGTIDGNAVDITVTTAWQRFGAVFDVPVDCKNLVLVVFSDSQVTTTNGIAITQVSLTLGQQIVEWQPLAVQQELGRVQRYYFKSFDIDTLPAQNIGLNGALRGAVSVAGATANQPIGLRAPVAHWQTLNLATATFYNPSAANAFVRNTTAGTNATATALANTGDQGADVTFTGIAAWTVAQAVAVHYTIDGEL